MYRWLLIAIVVGCTSSEPSQDVENLTLAQRRSLEESLTSVDPVTETVDPCLADPQACCPDDADPVVLSPADDKFKARRPGLCVIAGAGSDKIHVLTSGSSAVVAGPGDDAIHGGRGNDVVFGGDGRDRIFAGAGADEISGDAGSDFILAGHGDDRVVPGPGRDNAYLGGGNDLLVIHAPCEIPPGETLDGGEGFDTLVTPLSLDELRALGVIVSGFEKVRVENGACFSQCVAKPECPEGLGCVAGSEPGVAACAQPPTFVDPGGAPPPEPEPPPPPTFPLSARYDDFASRLSDHFPFLRTADTGASLRAAAGGFKQYHAYSSGMSALLHLEGTDSDRPNVARLTLFDRLDADTGRLAAHEEMVRGFLEALGASSNVDGLLAFIAPGTAGPALERRSFSGALEVVVVTLHRDYGMATIEPLLSDTEFVWTSSMGPVLMGPSAGRACFFTQLGGRFDGGAEHVEIVERSGDWYIEGGSHVDIEQPVLAKARCFPTPSLSAEVIWSQGQAARDLGPAEGQACFLSRVQGDFEGNGEMFRVVRRDGRWLLEGSSAQDDDNRAGARCVPARNVSEPFTWNDGDASVNMGSGPSRFCFLTRVQGDFAGLAEHVDIVPSAREADVFDWLLTGHSNQPGEVSGSAVCFNP